MKIMFVLTAYERGGTSTVARNLLDFLIEEKINVALLIENLSDRHYPIDSRIKVVDLKISPRKNFLLKIFNVARHLLSMRRVIAIESPDVVMSFAFQANCYTLLSLLFRFGKRPKVIITEHTEEMFLKTKNNDLKYKFFRFFYKTLMLFLYGRADHIIAVSKAIAEHVKKIFFVSQYKVKVIYNPVAIDKIKKLSAEGGLSINFEDKVPYIATISRLSKEKGVHFLIHGFKILSEDIDARLIIIGDGIDRLLLERMAEDLKIREKVIFTGWVDNPFKYLKKTNVFVLPSLWEGFPMAVLEAMVCGIPAIVTDSSGGIREVIRDGINGLLIKSGSPVSISKSIHDLLSNNKKIHSMVEEAYKTVRHFDISEIKGQYKTLIFN